MTPPPDARAGATGAPPGCPGTASDYLSGKGRLNENFPVASRLVARPYRAPILAFYRFARTADDVADHPTLAPALKLRLLDGLGAALTGRGEPDPAAEPLRRALAARGLADRHALDLLEAFRLDVTKSRYRTWRELLDYCRLSAMPVGRFVLETHAEDPALLPQSDMLCTALQIINHMQDCGADYRRLDRVYLPLDLMAQHGAAAEHLREAASSPALRACLDEMIQRCRPLLDESADLPRRVRDRRLGAELAVIQRLAAQQLAHLAHCDPLLGRARPSRLRSLSAAALAVGRHALQSMWAGPAPGSGALGGLR